MQPSQPGPAAHTSFLLSALTNSTMGTPLRRIIPLLFFLTGLLVMVWIASVLPVLKGTTVMSLPLHIFLETFSIAIAVMVFGVAYVSRIDRTEPVIFLGCALLVVGLLDFGHMLSFKGMPDFVTPANAEKGLNFWLAGRLFFAVAMLIFVLLPWRPQVSPRRRYWLLAGGLLWTGLIYWLALYHQPLWPHTFIEGQGLTPLKIGAEYTAIAIILVTAALLFRRARNQATPYAAASLFAALITSGLSEFAFTLYTDVNDILNLTGHLYKMLAYGFIYHAVFVTSIREPFQRLGQANEELAQARKRYAILSELAPVGIFRSDAAGDCLYVNDRWAQISGLSPEESLGHNFLLTLHPEDRLRVNREWEETIQKQQEFSDKYRFQRPDGKITWVFGQARAELDSNGQLVGYVGCITDISELKEAEKQLLQSEFRLNQAHKMEAIGTLAGGIAHDFNNILSIILGYAEMAKDDAPPNSPLINDLDNVLTAGGRAQDLVKQILAFSRQESVARFPLQLQSLVKEALKMLRSSIPTTIEIQNDIDSRCGVVLADPTQVHQILMNLCTNASQAMEKSGGILKVELKSIYVDQSDQQLLLNLEPGEYVKLIVSDTGPGIDPDVLDKIFDPYFTTKGVGKGTGMGLAIVHGIINDYGGSITAESELGKGATFNVYFPVASKEELSLEESDKEIPQGKGRVLYVDDEELLARVGKDMLERLGYTVTVRQSSLEALATFQESPEDFDVIVTDQTMPDLTGSDLARLVLEIRPDIPIILCTGYSNLIDEETAKNLGIKEFAMKPLTKGVLARLLHKVLNAS